MRRTLLADRDANDLQGFASDIKEAVTMFKASSYLIPQTLSANISSYQWSTDICRGSANDSAVCKCVLFDLNIQGLIFIEEKKEEAMFQKLNKIPRTDRAGYDSRRQSAPVRCLEHTRTEVLKRIWHWITPSTQATATEPTSDDIMIVEPTVSDIAIDPTPVTAVNSSSDTAVQPIYWVNGIAGIGKSTIARTVAEDAKNRNLLGASFFFSRQEKELSNADLFISTIAYQLVRSYPEARSVIIKVFEHEPDIVKKSFATQFKELIIEPLHKITSKPVLIVVDALDECDNAGRAADELLQAVVEHCTKSPSLRLLITSRPELYIKRVLTNTAGIVLHEALHLGSYGCPLCRR